jgi:excisionase family DNA binding protein
MQAQLSFDFQELAQVVTRAVVQGLAPLLARGEEGDSVLTVKTLAQYLRVDPGWVYKQVSLKTIPYFKNGKYVRFRKRDIDRWIETQTIKPIPPMKFQ